MPGKDSRTNIFNKPGYQQPADSHNGQKPGLPPMLLQNRPKPPAHYCPKMHMLHMFQSRGNVKCKKCASNCQLYCWGCLGCKHFECVKCQPYSRFYCPYNDFLRPTVTLNIDTGSLVCSMCEGAVKGGSSLSCASCNYHLCSKCLQ